MIGVEKYEAYLTELYELSEIGIDVSRWKNIPIHVLSRTGEKIYDYAIFGIKLRSIVSFLEAQAERESQAQAMAGAPLTDEQVDLLRYLVMANRNVAAAQRQEIRGISGDGVTRFFHPGFPDRALTPNSIDLKRLTQLGLVDAYGRGRRKGWVIDVLPAGEAAIDAIQSSTRRSAPASPAHPKLPEEFQYHVAISYAGPDIQYAEDLATLVEQEGYKVFFDKAKPDEVWGKDLHRFLQEVFAEQALFCVLFVSDEYKDRIWTNKELQDALSRQVKQRGNTEYILPIRLSRGASLAGLPNSIAYLSIEDHTIESIRDLLVKKIDDRINSM